LRRGGGLREATLSNRSDSDFCWRAGCSRSPARKGEAAVQSDQTAYKAQLHSVLEMRRALPAFEIVWRYSPLLLPSSKRCHDAIGAGSRINESGRM
jgi:hypothetical protein